MKKTFTLILLIATLATTAQRINVLVGTSITKASISLAKTTNPILNIEYNHKLSNVVSLSAAVGTYKYGITLATTDALGNTGKNMTFTQNYLTTTIGAIVYPVDTELRPFIFGNVGGAFVSSTAWYVDKRHFIYSGGIGVEYNNNKLYYKLQGAYLSDVNNKISAVTIQLGLGIKIK